MLYNYNVRASAFMFTKQEYKNYIAGCFETMVFMKSVIDGFPKDKGSAIKSFIWVAVFLPLSLFAFSFHAVGYSLPVIMVIHAVRMILALFLSLTVVYFFCKQFQKEEGFWQYVTICNWMNIPIFIMLLPIFLTLVSHWLGFGAYESYHVIVKNYESYAVFITMLAYVYNAYVMTHALKVPW